MLAVLGAADWPEPSDHQQAVHRGSNTNEDLTSASISLANGSSTACVLSEGWRVGEAWGLGREATLSEFMSHVGVDFAERTVEEKGKLGGRLGVEEFL